MQKRYPHLFWILSCSLLFFSSSCHGPEKKSATTSLQDSKPNVKSQRLLYLSQQNNIGNPANDFTYRTPRGIQKKLYNLKADYTLLFFYNPECQACKDMKAALSASGIISSSMASGQLKMLAMYIDSDTVLWRRHLPELPPKWIAGCDENEYLYKNNVYDLRAIPSLYLLDKNKRVLLKDCMALELIEQRIASVR